MILSFFLFTFISWVDEIMKKNTSGTYVDVNFVLHGEKRHMASRFCFAKCSHFLKQI